MKIISWNINGIRAIHRKGFLDWFQKEQADVVCVQEIKAHTYQFPDELIHIPGYHFFMSMGERKGYSGVAVWTQMKPLRVQTQVKNKALDGEGRILELEFEKYILYTVYFPNGKASPERLRYKMDFYSAFLNVIIKKKKPVIFCGDINTAHREEDLARPKENKKTSGFLPEERKWIDTVLEKGFIDSFRLLHAEQGQYTWWDQKTRARERNVGWRIDYFFVDKKLIKKIQRAEILSEVIGSDHCPVLLEIAV